MKTFLSCILLLLAGEVCFSQQQAVYFFKKNGTEVKLRDSADYYRVVQMPDTGSKLFTVNEYFIIGTQKLVGKASKISPLVFEGQVASFYPSGKKKQLANYQNNRLCGLFYDFYPNGKIHAVRQFPEQPAEDDYNNYRITDCLDSAGNVLVKDGGGYYISLNNGVHEEGPVKQGLRDSDWKGSDKVFHVSFNEHYEQGKLISGVAIDADGKKHDYQQRYVTAHYRDGRKALYATIFHKMDVLRNDMIANVNGTAYVQFTITPAGKIEHISVLNSTSESMNDMISLAVASTVKGWVPASAYGIPVQTVYTLPMSFTTQGLQGIFD